MKENLEYGIYPERPFFYVKIGMILIGLIRIQEDSELFSLHFTGRDIRTYGEGNQVKAFALTRDEYFKGENRVDTFISYASDIKKTAGRIKEYLDQYGFNCFLAHEDIPPQTVWPDEILKALNRCDLFLPLLTSRFVESFFCQQEIGFAYCKGVEILPVMIPREPMGMIANLQAVKFDRNEFDSSCWKIVRHIAKRESLSEPVLDALVTWFGQSDSYDTAAERAKKILNEFDFTPHQVKKIQWYIKGNSQIHETKEARDSILRFIDKYQTYFDQTFKDWYDSKRASRMWMRY